MTHPLHPLVVEVLRPTDELLAATQALAEYVVEGSEQADDLSRVRDATVLLQERLRALGRGDHEAGAKRIRHDLRTPLNHILGYGEMLQDDLDRSPEQGARVLLSRILHRGRHVLGVIDELVEDVVSGGAVQATPMPVAIRHRPPPAVVREVPQGGRLLVADDNPANLDLLSRMLTPLGHTVDRAADGEEALQALADASYDLLLLDVMMPKLDGYEVLRRVKQAEATRHLPVLMITSLDDLSSAVRCIGMGAADYLTKPFEPVLLQARIRSCLEAKRLRDQQVEVMDRVSQERKRAHELLRVILPDPVVEELEQTNRVKPRRYEHVAVLFSDIVGFTRYCDQKQPEEVVPLLQQLVEAMEEVVESHGMQKIKTIGDGFMAVAGLLQPVEHPVAASVRCASELMRLPAQLGIDWQLRIGIHVGPVVAGVLGRRQFQYDLWGDTVNTAARVESYGVNGGITLSRSAWHDLEASGAEARGGTLGHVEVKGKGQVELMAFHGFAAT
jgi:class 3 adenylate cyclase/CheY-like chemotaxis protein